MSAAPNIMHVTVDAGEVKFDGNLKVGQLRRMSKGEDFDGIISVLTEIVLEWPFDGEPSDAAAWDELGITQFNDMVAGITTELGKALNP